MRYYFVVILSLFLAVSQLSEAAAKRSSQINTSSPKYAALVMDADTGEVFYERNSKRLRYPASLTKMMTLYMTFDQIRKGRMSFRTKLKVSKKAASQPQTNIGIKTSDRISVRDAIKALVVRSANDVALVLAENIGGSEKKFARLMTYKAHQLGMNHTNFRNAHGLPDSRQYTTARDMAKLGIALKRDFPQFYHFFTTKKFTWKGKKFKSHNHVLDMFPGVNGIKTGYIRKSGFNLVTSVSRKGYNLVAVIMGGSSGKARDKHMVSLLQSTFLKVASRGDRPRRFAKAAPLPTLKPTVRRSKKVIKIASIQKEEYDDGFIGEGDRGDKVSEVYKILHPVDKPIINLTSIKATKLPASEAEEKVKLSSNVTTKMIPISKPIRNVKQLKERLTETATVKTKTPATEKANNISSNPKTWGVQVGVFMNKRNALKTAANAMKATKEIIGNSKVNITGMNGGKIHRVRLANLTKSQAKSACQNIYSKAAPCFVYQQ